MDSANDQTVLKLVWCLDEEQFAALTKSRADLIALVSPHNKVKELLAAIDWAKNAPAGMMSKEDQTAKVKQCQSEIDAINVKLAEAPALPEWAIVSAEGIRSVKVETAAAPSVIDDKPITWGNVLEKSGLSADAKNKVPGCRIDRAGFKAFGAKETLAVYVLHCWQYVIDDMGQSVAKLIDAYKLTERGQLVRISTAKISGKRGDRAEVIGTGSSPLCDDQNHVIVKWVDVASLPQNILDVNRHHTIPVEEQPVKLPPQAK
jgi:hypothetical protein